MKKGKIMAEYDNTNSGALFTPIETYLLKTGKINVEGDENYYSLTETTTKSGKKVYEVHMKVGAMFINDRKSKDTDPDISGSITKDGIEYMVWGRKRESKTGTKFTSISLAEKTNQAKSESSAKDYAKARGIDTDFNDDVPF